MGAKTTRSVTGAEEMGLGNVAEETFCHRTMPIFATWLPSLVYIPLHNRLRLRRHQIPQRIATKKSGRIPSARPFVSRASLPVLSFLQRVGIFVMILEGRRIAFVPRKRGGGGKSEHQRARCRVTQARLAGIHAGGKLKDFSTDSATENQTASGSATSPG